MRDYRDAKAMAQTLRQGLKTRSIDITHSTALELIAKTLGFKDWQVLAARIEADLSATRPPDPPPEPVAAPSTLYCSFCGKTQHEVAKLIAGPDVFICDECVELCGDIVTDQTPEKYIEAQQALAGKSTEDLILLKAKAQAGLVQTRHLVDLIRSVSSDAQADGPARPNPQRRFNLRMSPQERAAYLSAVEERMAGIQRVAETAAGLLADRGVSLGPIVGDNPG